MGVKVCPAQVSSFHFIRRRSQHERLAWVATREARERPGLCPFPRERQAWQAVHAHTLMCAHMCTQYIRTRTRVCTDTCARAYMHVCVHTHACTDKHTRPRARYACTCGLCTHAHRLRITFAHTHVPGPGGAAAGVGKPPRPACGAEAAAIAGGAVKEAPKAPEGRARHVRAEGHVLQGSVACVSP